MRKRNVLVLTDGELKLLEKLFLGDTCYRDLNATEQERYSTISYMLADPIRAEVVTAMSITEHLALAGLIKVRRSVFNRAKLRFGVNLAR